MMMSSFRNIAILFSLSLAGLSPAFAADPDMGDHPEFAHAMKVETKKVDGLAVVFHYGQVRPDFNNLSNDEDSISRESTKLSGEWMFQFDPEGQGIQERWFSEGRDTKDWQKVSVPHCWDTMPGGRFWDWSDRSVKNPAHYNGASWYQKEFEFSPKQGKRQRIAFLGVQQRARVYLNGKEIAMHEGGGAPFSIDVSEHIKSGKNTLALKIVRLPNFKRSDDGKDWHEIKYLHTLHPVAPDCWPYAGILRDVFLIEESAVTIRKAIVHPAKDGLHAAVVISNHGNTTLELRALMTSSIDTGDIERSPFFSIAPNQTVVKKMVITGVTAKAKAWSPDSPQLYKAFFRLERKKGEVIDQQSTTFGVRSFVVDGTQFKLNQKPIFLKGASLYAETPARGNALTPQDHRDLFNKLEDSRSNFARMHVTQRHPYAYQLADEKGVLVCGEWAGFWYKPESMIAQTNDPYSIYQTMARCAVWDLLNNPSVVLWGLHNESHQFGDGYKDFVQMGRKLVREIDPLKRPITWSGWHPYHGQTHYEYADVVGFNEYRGALDKFELLDPDMQKVVKRNPGKPFIIMENGAWSKRGSRGSVHKKNNENWQADLLKRQWEILTKYSPNFSGYTYWLLQDYRSRKPYTGKKSSNGYSRMGIYDEFGRPKELVREVFRNLSNPLEK